jgi:zona occludens toxin
VITVITGLPGNGKTLYALAWLQAKAEKEGRTVYYSGIADLKVPGWVEFDAEKWTELPTGSYILVDEAQRVYRPRAAGSKVPAYVEALETHRHKGVDLVLITQHPMLLDGNVRRLAGQHFHIVRKFGAAWSTVHEWGRIKENCDKSRADSSRIEFKFPKHVYGWYKSAEAHTHKLRLPPRVVLFIAMPFILAALGYLAWTKLDPDRRAEAARQKAKEQGAQPITQQTARPGQLMTAAQYVEQFAPRVQGLAYTAPIYDQVTQPTEAPYPAACVVMRDECRCYTQQATRLDVGDDLCRQIVAKGFFVGWQQPRQLEAKPTPAKAASPLS